MRLVRCHFLLLSPFSIPNSLFRNSFHPFLLLPLLIQLPILNNPLRNLTGIDMLEIVRPDLLVNPHGLCIRVRVARERHGRGWAVVDGTWCSEGEAV